MGKKLLMLFAFMSLLGNAAGALHAQSALSPLTHAQEALIWKIEGRLRDEVTALVASGKSEQEIITYYRTKYGETILVVPDGWTGQLLTATPLLLFVASAGLLVGFIRKAVSTKGRLIALSAPVGVAAERSDLKQRIRAELGDF